MASPQGAHLQAAFLPAPWGRPATPLLVHIRAGLGRGVVLPDPDEERGPHPSAVEKSRRSRADVPWASTCGCCPLSRTRGCAGRRWGHSSSTPRGLAQSHAKSCPPVNPNALLKVHRNDAPDPLKARGSFASVSTNDSFKKQRFMDPHV